jgi:hypothetical protein
LNDPFLEQGSAANPSEVLGMPHDIIKATTTLIRGVQKEWDIVAEISS